MPKSPVQRRFVTRDPASSVGGLLAGKTPQERDQADQRDHQTEQGHAVEINPTATAHYAAS